MPSPAKGKKCIIYYLCSTLGVRKWLSDTSCQSNVWWKEEEMWL